ncbi:MAG: hypothetical protein Q8941_09975 [Bacteroidota bacterium]|nr:hypothetical protein [Bacteroidota bacterium]
MISYRNNTGLPCRQSLTSIRIYVDENSYFRYRGKVTLDEENGYTELSRIFPKEYPF